MAAAKAKLHSLLSKVGSLGYSLVPPGDQVKRRVYGVQQKAHTPKFRNPWRKKKKKHPQCWIAHLLCSYMTR